MIAGITPLTKRWLQDPLIIVKIPSVCFCRVKKKTRRVSGSSTQEAENTGPGRKPESNPEALFR